VRQKVGSIPSAQNKCRVGRNLALAIRFEDVAHELRRGKKVLCRMRGGDWGSSEWEVATLLSEGKRSKFPFGTVTLLGWGGEKGIPGQTGKRGWSPPRPGPHRYLEFLPVRRALVTR